VTTILTTFLLTALAFGLLISMGLVGRGRDSGIASQALIFAGRLTFLNKGSLCGRAIKPKKVNP
jgi:hypothetical protein